MAHAKKRRFILTRDEYMRAALLCRACHNDLEFNGHERMDTTIGKLIEAR